MRHAVLAVLLASAYLAAGQEGLVQTDTFKCDPLKCEPPTCRCPAYTPPGDLPLEEVPQFVMISHDNALDSLPYEAMQGVLGKKQQANGCPVPVTWFAMFYHSGLARGDQVAMQTNRFNPTDPFTATDPAPKYDSRDPKTGEPSALSKEGYLYDTSLVERYYPNSPTSPSVSQVLWPYTMDAGIPQECNFLGEEVGKCAPGENYHGLWEVPLYQAQIGGELYGVGNYASKEALMPPIPTDMESFLKDLLDERLANSKAPLSISTIYGWLVDESKNVDPTCNDAGCEHPPNDNAKALSAFIDYALKKPDVRFVTYSDLIRWMQHPVPLSQFDEWVQCKVPGIKADLTAVNLTDAEKANSFYMLESAEPVAVEVPAPAPVPAPALAVEAPAPAVVVETPAPVVAPVVTKPVVAAPAPAPTTAPGNGASALSTAVAAAAAMLGALLLAL
ncbi:hypothetical protein CHLNCDRAFT_57507 [Chlorella variabilis]|uniref:Uncharacterized protein n=1 Tax=Chlorella variabilis TaxID=554065 RepID=E1ZCC9_CHLVA|nr:hypothetical protein CHLNCDRAFT_57507 [Chlorella variabilis]EFN56795.1 hypothetical protein CHLNCDRAFT_57507 [Chlorella variabilis]|eukprot:XP_005848897.1 hypothetical protein CHLNCDRAFT_57507 [Chlorella variabilis]